VAVSEPSIDALCAFADLTNADIRWLMIGEGARAQDAVAGIRLAIDIVKEANVPAALNPDAATEHDLKVVILGALEARIRELAG
jgi:hypothetical protein